jgi:hypothetical protein
MVVTLLWRHFTMELRVAVVVWVSSDSQYVRLGITQWIQNRKRNGWKNSKKKGVANATLWRELDAAIARMGRVELAWTKAHSGILVNECADRLATRGVSGDSYGQVIPVPEDGPESEAELEIADEDVAQVEECDDPEHVPPTGVPAVSVGLAAEEQLEEQEEMFGRFQLSLGPRWNNHRIRILFLFRANQTVRARARFSQMIQTVSSRSQIRITVVWFKQFLAAVFSLSMSLRLGR